MTASVSSRRSFAFVGTAALLVSSPLLGACGSPAALPAASRQGAASTCAVPPTHSVPEVQGRGAATPLLGQTVTVRGVVVADLQAGGLGGYHLQDATGDGDPATSDAVFVYDADADPAVRLGDEVQVTGRATEFQGLTEIDRVTATTVCASDIGRPPAVALDLPASSSQLEALEGMGVRPVDPLTVSGVGDLDRHGEVVLSEGGRLLAPTEVAEPGEDARAVMASNAARRVILDDGRTADLTHPPVAPPYLTSNNPVRVGDTVGAGALEDVVLSYGFDAYRLQPADGVADATRFSPTNPRKPSPAGPSGDVRVASFNVLNYFVTFVPGVSRGAADETELGQQQAKIVSALTALRADVVALQEIENSSVTTPEDPYRAVRTLVAAVNAADRTDSWHYVEAAEASDVITSAVIYRSDRVQPVGAPSKPAEDDVWDNAREPIAQAFVADGDTFTVVANHLKSKGSGEGPGNTDAGDGQGASNADRVAQARSLVAFVADVVQQAGDPDVLLMGDFNSYSREDPLDVVRDAGYVDLGEALNPGEYSYVFRGESGSLDHAFASPSMAAKATGTGTGIDVDIWDINAVESSAYQYDAAYEGLYAPDPYRASDHDPEVVDIAP